MGVQIGRGEKVEMPWEAPELCAASSSQHESS